MMIVQDENCFLNRLDLSTRTTRDYEGPMISPIIQAALSNALKDDDHMELDAR